MVPAVGLRWRSPEHARKDHQCECGQIRPWASVSHGRQIGPQSRPDKIALPAGPKASTDHHKPLLDQPIWLIVANLLHLFRRERVTLPPLRELDQ